MGDNDKNHPVVLVTGGAGFLGKAIVSEFLAEDSLVRPYELRIYDISPSPGYTDSRVVYRQGDIRDYDRLKEAVSGADLVIHTAAIVDWGTRTDEEVLAVNFGGTENVVKACKECNVGRLIFTSSLDAVYGGRPLIDIDESVGYPEKHSTAYCRSKYLSEKLVLSQNGDDLRTCVLRPSDIYGEADPYHMDSLINMAKAGFYVRLGNGNAKSQHVYVGNMAYAHNLAARGLFNGNDHIAGKAYFITDGPGTNFFRFFDRIVEMAGYRIRPKNLWLPRWFAYGIGSISEFFAWLVRPLKYYHPKLSRFAVIYTTTDFTFSAKRAENDMGFRPKYNEEEAIRRTADYYRIQRN